MGFGGDSGPARAGWACLGPDAAASVQAWHWDICGAQAHQLLSPCHRQLYLNIHTKCRLMCACLAPHGVPRTGQSVKLPKEVVGAKALRLLRREWKAPAISESNLCLRGDRIEGGNVG